MVAGAVYIISSACVLQDSAILEELKTKISESCCFCQHL